MSVVNFSLAGLFVSYFIIFLALFFYSPYPLNFVLVIIEWFMVVFFLLALELDKMEHRLKRRVRSG